MSSKSNYNPVEINEIISSSHNDVDSMQKNLAKLKSLSEDDKTENAMLRSRLDEQSQLIMFLKQRADEKASSIQTLERINKEMEDFRNSATEEIEMHLKRYNMLDQRFNDLASNHQQMIDIKDEYKRVNEELRRENYRLKNDNEKLFSKEIEDRDKKISDLERRARGMKDQYIALDSRHRNLEQDLTATNETLKSEVKEVNKKLQEAQERLKGAEAKLKHMNESSQNADLERNTKIQALTKEKDELLNLAMSRGKLIQDKQAENKKLEQKILQAEKALRDTESKHERDAASVNVNMQVRKLRDQLSDADHKYEEVVREFDAFKKHSNNLLKKEKDLNEKLRHLMG